MFQGFCAAKVIQTPGAIRNPACFRSATNVTSSASWTGRFLHWLFCFPACLCMKHRIPAYVPCPCELPSSFWYSFMVACFTRYFYGKCRYYPHTSKRNIKELQNPLGACFLRNPCPKHEFNHNLNMRALGT